MKSCQPTHASAGSSKCHSAGKFLRSSIGQQFLDSSDQIGRLRKNFILKIGMIRAESIHRRNAPNGSVQLIEKLLADARGNLRTVSPGERVLIGHDRAVGLAHGGGDRLPVEWRKRAEIDDFDRNSLALQFSCRNFGAMNHCAIRNNAYVRPLADNTSASERDRELRAGIGRTVV